MAVGAGDVSIKLRISGDDPDSANATSRHWRDLSEVKTSARLPEDGGNTAGWLALVWGLGLGVCV